MNIVREIHEICNELGIEFRFGVNSAINLLDNTESDVIYFCLLPPERSCDLGEYGGLLKRTWTCEAYILVQSRLENTIYSEGQYNELEGKYNRNIYPLYKLSDQLRERLSTCDIFITSWGDSQIYNSFDANLDGLKVNFVYNE